MTTDSLLINTCFVCKLWSWNCSASSVNQNKNSFEYTNCTKNVNQQRIDCLLAALKKQWICLISLYLCPESFFRSRSNFAAVVSVDKWELQFPNIKRGLDKNGKLSEDFFWPITECSNVLGHLAKMGRNKNTFWDISAFIMYLFDFLLDRDCVFWPDIITNKLILQKKIKNHNEIFRFLLKIIGCMHSISCSQQQIVNVWRLS